MNLLFFTGESVGLAGVLTGISSCPHPPAKKLFVLIINICSNIVLHIVTKYTYITTDAQHLHSWYFVCELQTFQFHSKYRFRDTVYATLITAHILLLLVGNFTAAQTKPSSVLSCFLSQLDADWTLAVIATNVMPLSNLYIMLHKTEVTFWIAPV